MSTPSQAISNPSPSSTKDEDEDDQRVIVEENLEAREDDPIIVVGGSYAGEQSDSPDIPELIILSADGQLDLVSLCPCDSLLDIPTIYHLHPSPTTQEPTPPEP